MKLRKEVIDRLLLAKSLLLPWVNERQANAHLVARALLSAHDAADLVFAAVADHKRKLTAKGRSPSMLDCLSLLGQGAHGYIPYFKQLNDARNSLKHVGNLPNTQQWADVAEDVLRKLSDICRSMVGKALEEITELELVLDQEVRDRLELAGRYERAGEYKSALEETGKALCAILRGQIDLYDIEVGKPKAEDALKLTAFGIPANDFLRLQEFLPQVSRFFGDPYEVRWAQSKFGHPGNWREDAVAFCLDQCRLVALSIQTTSGPPHALDFHTLYQYRVTAKEDDVEVWEDLIEGHFEEIGSQTSRKHKRYLRKGESIDVSAHARPFVSDDFSLSGELVKRVMVSMDTASVLFGTSARAEFVELEKVKIVCVAGPLRNLIPQTEGLREVDWEPDPELARELASRAAVEEESVRESDGDS